MTDAALIAHLQSVVARLQQAVADRDVALTAYARADELRTRNAGSAVLTCAFRQARLMTLYAWNVCPPTSENESSKPCGSPSADGKAASRSPES